MPNDYLLIAARYGIETSVIERLLVNEWICKINYILQICTIKTIKQLQLHLVLSLAHRSDHQPCPTCSPVRVQSDELSMTERTEAVTVRHEDTIEMNSWDIGTLTKKFSRLCISKKCCVFPSLLAFLLRPLLLLLLMILRLSMHLHRMTTTSIILIVMILPISKLIKLFARGTTGWLQIRLIRCCLPAYLSEMMLNCHSVGRQVCEAVMQLVCHAIEAHSKAANKCYILCTRNDPFNFLPSIVSLRCLRGLRFVTATPPRSISSRNFSHTEQIGGLTSGSFIPGACLCRLSV